MFCVCLRFLYEHQIKKIDSSLIPTILRGIEVIARNNGCKKIIKRDSYFYFFEHLLSSSFLTLSFLHSLSLLLKQVYNDIHESSVIVEYFSDEDASDEDAIGVLNELQNINLDFNWILAGLKASKYFKKYILLDVAKAPPLKRFTSFSFFENMNDEVSFQGDDKSSLFFRKDQNYIRVLYDFILSHPIFDSDVELMLKQEAKTYFETRCVLSFYSQNRFNTSLPKYFVDAFIIYAKLHIKIYKNKHNIKQITIYTDCIEENADVEKLRQILDTTKVSTLPEKAFEIEEIPDDLLESIYILIFSTRFIFYNETEDFFFAVTETKTFKNLMKVMYQRGIILQRDCIFSYQSVAIERIEKKLKEKKDYFASLISKYIWSKYKNAEICCDINLKKVFDLLKFQYDITLNIDIFFNLKKHCILLKSDENDTNFENIDVLKKYDTITKLKNNGRFNEAFSVTKELHSYFHNAKMLSGEYRSCALLGLSFLESNNIGEALTYFVYSLEIARKIKRVNFICESLCYLSIVYFLQKDFQNCAITLQELGNSISLFFMQEWKVFYLFIQARVFVELGEVKKASAVFKLAKDFSSLYFNYLEKTCNIWYGRALIYEGKVQRGKEILEAYEDGQALLFLLESLLLFPEVEQQDVFELKKKYDKLPSQFEVFPFFEDLAWYTTYKKSTVTRLFEAFYNYYMIMFCPKNKTSQLNEYLIKLEEIAMTSLYSKDNNASIYLYLSYIVQCKIEGKVTGKALGFLSKACNIMQKNTSLMYETNMRDKFMKQNIWNGKLFKSSIENKLI